MTVLVVLLRIHDEVVFTPHLDFLCDQRLCDRDADAEHVARPGHVPGDIQGQGPDARPERGDEPREEVSEGVETEGREDRGRHGGVLRTIYTSKGTMNTKRRGHAASRKAPLGCQSCSCCAGEWLTLGLL